MIRFAVALLTSITAFGGTVFTMDTSSLAGNPNGPFTLDFSFTDGSGTDSGNNTITVSNFVLGSGSLTLAYMTGGVTVNTSPLSITLTDNTFFDDAQFTFVADTSLSFQVDSTLNPDDMTPDTFTVAILDGNFDNIPTTNPNNGVAFIEFDLPTTDPTAGLQVITSGSVSNADDINIPAPTSAVSEPSTSALFGLAFLIMAAICSATGRRWVIAHPAPIAEGIPTGMAVAQGASSATFTDASGTVNAVTSLTMTTSYSGEQNTIS